MANVQELEARVGLEQLGQVSGTVDVQDVPVEIEMLDCDVVLHALLQVLHASAEHFHRAEVERDDTLVDGEGRS